MVYVITSTQSLNIQNSEEKKPRVTDGEKVTARFSSCNYSCQIWQ